MCIRDRVYTESRPERLPLSQNKEFKSVKNMVIAEAMKLNLPTDEVEETDEPTEPDREPTAEDCLLYTSETVFMFALFKCRKSDKGRN